MRRSLQIIVFLKNLATGIMAPVLSLALLAHGASISTISLLIGIYSFTVIVSEFPSGVFADCYGRKRSFLLSSVLFFISYCLILSCRSIAGLCGAMVANGLGRAFASGSIDAQAIDEAGGNDGALARIAARLSVLESAGLAIGALSGGLLSGLDALYMGNLGASALIYALLFFLTLFCVHEVPRARKTLKGTPGRGLLGAQVRDSIAFVLQKGMIRALVLLSLATGFALISVETYWQPALSSLQAASWVFGATSFTGYVFVIAGSWLAERLLMRHAKDGAVLFLLFKAILGAGLILLAFRLQGPYFISVYMAVYFFLGSGSVVENTLLNQAAPANQRASILSLFSFILQIGGLIASLCGYGISARAGFRTIWLIAGAALILCAGIFAWIRWRNKRRSRIAGRHTACDGAGRP